MVWTGGIIVGAVVDFVGERWERASGDGSGGVLVG